MTNLSEQFIRVHKVFWQYCGSNKINSLGPKRLLKTQIFEKKAIFAEKERFWPIISRIIECDKPQGTICKGPKGVLTITVEVIRSFL